MDRGNLFAMLAFAIITFGYAASSAYATTYSCTTCAVCTNYLTNTSMSSGDVLQLTSSISNYASGTCIDFGGKDNVTFDCLGNTIDGDDSGTDFGIYLSDSSSSSVNNTVKNCVLTDFYYGLFVRTGSNDTFQGITANSNTQDGIYLYMSPNNTLRSIIASSNARYGISLDASPNNTLSDVTSSSNSLHGLYLSSSSNNTLQNITASHNLQSGIYLYSSSQYNRINNSRIENNSQYGIYLQDFVGSYPRYNTFYNNYINNSVNLGSTSSSNTNYWNATKDCTKTNIIGGSCIGGNYWSQNDTDGNFSDSCTDANGDGICDSSYNPVFSENDYLPLNPVTYNCTSCSDCNAKIASATPYDTVRLTASISNYASGTCISFGGKDNITFDCQGNTIDGTDAGGSYGIWLNDSNGGSNNNTIKNCTVTDFASGLRLYSSSNNTLSSITSNSNTQYGLYLNSASNNTIQNIVLNSNPNYGLYLSSSSNNSIRNATMNSNGFGYGITMESSSSWNILQDIVANSNIVGLSLNSGSNNTFQNVTASSNSQYGIYIDSSSNNALQNVTTNSNTGTGILLSSASNNALQDVTASSNTNFGLFLDSSSNNTISNLTASNSLMCGIKLVVSQYNSINDSYIMNNAQFGIVLNSSGSYSSYNLFYNNNINNSVNIGSDSASNTNYWNITKNCSRANIVGTSCIGGNYWTGPSGSFSDTCVDSDANGICDSPYTPATNNIDYLPLAPERTVCTSCADCNAKIASASSGDIIQLNASISNQAGTCIQFGGKDNLIFDCLGNTIGGDGSGIDYGMWMNDSSGGSSGNTIKNCTLTGFYVGLMMEYGSGNTVANLTASSNTYQGLYIYGSAGNVFTAINSTNNLGCGAYLVDSQNNTLNSSRIQNNTQCGIYIRQFSPGYSPSYNSIYNNYFNNSVNFGSGDFGASNYWNTTLICTRTNIIGGPCIGGNYWTSPGGNFSDTCTDSDNNGVCDNSYNIGLSEYDYLPLSEKPAQLAFVSPTLANQSTTQSWIYVNVSSGETLSSCSLDWNNGTWQNLSMTVQGRYCNINMTSLTSGSYYFRVYGNDSTGHLNVTEDRQISVIKTLNCSTCDSCSAFLLNGSMVAGDTLQLTSSIINNGSGTCVKFGGLDNVTFDCLGNTIDGTDVAASYGISLNQSNGGSNYNTIRNCVVTDFEEAVYLYESSNNNISSINATSNTDSGFYLYSNCNNNTIQNIISNSNPEGLYTYQSSYNIITNMTANSNTYDIDLRTASTYNTILNSIFTSGSWSGVQLIMSSNNSFTNITVSLCQTAVYIFHSSKYNTINNSYIHGGFSLVSGGGTPIYNLIYNNYINGTAPVSGIYQEYWNTTLDCSKTNIIGGQCIGGNYWNNVSATGYSDSCTDADQNSICDSSYTPSLSNTDYLPLSYKFYRTFEGSAKLWNWTAPSLSGLTIRSGNATNWTWRTYSSGSGRSIAKGYVTNWSWKTET